VEVWSCVGGMVEVLGGAISWWFGIIDHNNLGSSFWIYYVNEWERYVTKGLHKYTRVR